ncbi:CapA family protein [Nocardioides pinisoli]|uniref:CapA family protein n=1 Tax=Nocardioides pinisoli TaxID=2950279 RepID=A0ABT1L222_9ACTN|nr:CapA family protein [Nocardioides pinisoli]MCP3422886.1 CapA family protein [Nocardioides pinisoli]
MEGRARHLAGVVACVLVASGCTSPSPAEEPPPPGAATGSTTTTSPKRSGQVTIALGGDVHFEGVADRLLERPGGLGSIARTLRAADVAMVNLETPVTQRGRRDPKELENAGDRYWFRTRPAALDVLADAGVDVVSVANNHAGDYGATGLQDTLAAGRERGVAMVGAGRGEAAYAPHVVEVGELEVAFLAADMVQREGSSDVWTARPGRLGTASARGSNADALVAAVEAASARDQLAVVYLHWGREYQSCPTQSQRLLARDLADAGADVVVGSHSHVLGGTGWVGDAVVGYGLGNFVWYHDRQAASGVLSVTLDSGGAVGKSWTPARISPDDGRPVPLAGASRARAVADWRDRRRCTGLAGERGQAQADDPAYASTVSRVDADLADRMRRSHRPGCPVPLRELRHLRMTHRDFDGRARTGEMVVHRRWADDVTEVFGRLYDAGFPIARMRLVDDYRADDDLSMAANNTSGFNCRRVAGQTSWSQHAYGEAIDINPVQNPYVRPGSIDPPAGRAYAGVRRDRSAPDRLGVIRAGDLPVTAFARIGWEWGGYWESSKDYQHVAAPRRR